MNQTHQHGGAPRQAFSRFGLPEKPVMDFSVNLNPLGPPPVIEEKWPDLFEGIIPYPGVEGEGVNRYYESACGLSSSNFLAGNGSTEMIYLAPRILGFKKAAILTPSFHDYERACVLAGTEVIRIPLLRDDGFAWPDENRMMETLKTVDALWLANPNNPTGNRFSRDLIFDLATKFPDKWFLVDEAFVQFLDDWKEESFLTKPPSKNVLTIHSLTKFFAIAGLRLGGIAGHESVIERLRGAKEPWTVNGIADRVAAMLVDYGDYENKTRAMVKKEGQRLFEALMKIDGITPFPPSANYLLCHWYKTRNLDDLLAHLLRKGFYIRDCRNFPGLEDNYFRLGLRIPEENDLLISHMAALDPV